MISYILKELPGVQKNFLVIYCYMAPFSFYYERHAKGTYKMIFLYFITYPNKYKYVTIKIKFIICSFHDEKMGKFVEELRLLEP